MALKFIFNYNDRKHYPSLLPIFITLMILPILSVTAVHSTPNSDTFNVGVVSSLTGSDAYTGNLLAKGISFWAETLNKKGGLITKNKPITNVHSTRIFVNLDIQDSNSNSTRSREIIENFQSNTSLHAVINAQRGEYIPEIINGLRNHDISSQSIPIKPILSCSGTIPSYFGDTEKCIPHHPYFFGVLIDSMKYVHSLWNDVVIRKLDDKLDKDHRVGILCNNATEESYYTCRESVRTARQAGLTVYPIDSTYILDVGNYSTVQIASEKLGLYKERGTPYDTLTGLRNHLFKIIEKNLNLTDEYRNQEVKTWLEGFSYYWPDYKGASSNNGMNTDGYFPGDPNFDQNFEALERYFRSRINRFRQFDIKTVFVGSGFLDSIAFIKAAREMKYDFQIVSLLNGPLYNPKKWEQEFPYSKRYVSHSNYISSFSGENPLIKFKRDFETSSNVFMKIIIDGPSNDIKDSSKPFRAYKEQEFELRRVFDRNTALAEIRIEERTRVKEGARNGLGDAQVLQRPMGKMELDLEKEMIKNGPPTGVEVLDWPGRDTGLEYLMAEKVFDSEIASQYIAINMDDSYSDGDYVIVPGQWHYSNNNSATDGISFKGNWEFRERWVEKYGEWPGGIEAGCSEAGVHLEMAMKKINWGSFNNTSSGSSGPGSTNSEERNTLQAELRFRLEHLEADTFFGNVRYSCTHQNTAHRPVLVQPKTMKRADRGWDKIPVAYRGREYSPPSGAGVGKIEVGIPTWEYRIGCNYTERRQPIENDNGVTVERSKCEDTEPDCGPGMISNSRNRNNSPFGKPTGKTGIGGGGGGGGRNNNNGRTPNRGGNSASSSTTCVASNRGYYKGETDTRQIECAAGTICAEGGCLECEPCPVGTHQPESGKWSCIPCSPGTYSSDTGSTQCMTCLPGSKRSEPSGDKCDYCAKGYWQNTTGAWNCTACPYSRTTRDVGSDHSDMCVCPEGYIGDSLLRDPFYESRCYRCPEGVICPIGSVVEVKNPSKFTGIVTDFSTIMGIESSSGRRGGPGGAGSEDNADTSENVGGLTQDLVGTGGGGRTTGGGGGVGAGGGGGRPSGAGRPSNAGGNRPSASRNLQTVAGTNNAANFDPSSEFNTGDNFGLNNGAGGGAGPQAGPGPRTNNGGNAGSANAASAGNNQRTGEYSQVINDYNIYDSKEGRRSRRARVLPGYTVLAEDLRKMFGVGFVKKLPPVIDLDSEDENPRNRNRDGSNGEGESAKGTGRNSDRPNSKTSNRARTKGTAGTDNNAATRRKLEHSSAHESTVSVYRCLSPASCPGDFVLSFDEDTCPFGGSGIACASCIPGFYWSVSSRQCLKCGALADSVSTYIVFPFLVLFGIASIWFFSCPTHSGRFLIEEVHLRVVAIKFTTSFSFLIANMQIYLLISKISNQNIDILMQPGASLAFDGFLHLQCFNDSGSDSSTGSSVNDLSDNAEKARYASENAALTEVIVTNLLPLFPILVVIFNNFLAEQTYLKNNVDPNFLPRKVYGMSILITLFETFFLSISSNAVATYTLTNHPFPNEDKQSSSRYPSILKSSSQWASMEAVSILALLIWCFGYIAVLLYYILKAQVTAEIARGKMIQRAQRLAAEHRAKLLEEEQMGIEDSLGMPGFMKSIQGERGGNDGNNFNNGNNNLSVSAMTSNITSLNPGTTNPVMLGVPTIIGATSVNSFNQDAMRHLASKGSYMTSNVESSPEASAVLGATAQNNTSLLTVPGAANVSNVSYNKSGSRQAAIASASANSQSSMFRFNSNIIEESMHRMGATLAFGLQEQVAHAASYNDSPSGEDGNKNNSFGFANANSTKSTRSAMKNKNAAAAATPSNIMRDLSGATGYVNTNAANINVRKSQSDSDGGAAFYARLLLPNYARFDDGFQVFGLALITRRFLLACVAFFPISREWRLASLIIILLFFMMINMVKRPYRFRLISRCDTIPMGIQVIVCIILIIQTKGDESIEGLTMTMYTISNSYFGPGSGLNTDTNSITEEIENPSDTVRSDSNRRSWKDNQDNAMSTASANSKASITDSDITYIGILVLISHLVGSYYMYKAARNYITFLQSMSDDISWITKICDYFCPLNKAVMGNRRESQTGLLSIEDGNSARHSQSLNSSIGGPGRVATRNSSNGMLTGSANNLAVTVSRFGVQQSQFLTNANQNAQQTAMENAFSPAKFNRVQRNYGAKLVTVLNMLYEAQEIYNNRERETKLINLCQKRGEACIWLLRECNRLANEIRTNMATSNGKMIANHFNIGNTEEEEKDRINVECPVTIKRLRLKENVLKMFYNNEIGNLKLKAKKSSSGLFPTKQQLWDPQAVSERSRSVLEGLSDYAIMDLRRIVRALELANFLDLSEVDKHYKQYIEAAHRNSNNLEISNDGDSTSNGDLSLNSKSRSSDQGSNKKGLLKNSKDKSLNRSSTGLSIVGGVTVGRKSVQIGGTEAERENFRQNQMEALDAPMVFNDNDQSGGALLNMKLFKRVMEAGLSQVILRADDADNSSYAGRDNYNSSFMNVAVGGSPNARGSTSFMNVGSPSIRKSNGDDRSPGMRVIPVDSGIMSNTKSGKDGDNLGYNRLRVGSQSSVDGHREPGTVVGSSSSKMDAEKNKKVGQAEQGLLMFGTAMDSGVSSPEGNSPRGAESPGSEG